MTVDRSSAHTRPDSLLGAIVGFEGIAGVACALNGPTGPKFGAAYLVDHQDPRDAGIDPAEYEQEFFFGQPRVPSTYLDELDYVHGSGAKLERLLRRLRDDGAQAVGIVNGPGTALIGDDLAAIAARSGLDVPVVAVEAGGLIGSASAGFAAALERLIEALPGPSGPAPQLALHGLTLLNLRWQDDLVQLREELALGGIGDVVCVGAGGSLDDLSRARAAQVAAPVHEAFGAGLAYRLGAVTLDVPLAPVGIPAAEEWLRAAVSACGADRTALEERIRDTRAALYRVLSRFSTRTGLPAGLSFVVCADAAIAAPLVLFLTDHLGMHPVAVLVRERSPEAEAFLSAFAAERGLAVEIVRDGSPLDEAALLERLVPDVLLGSTHDDAIARQALGRPLPFVPIAYPRAGHVALTRRPLLGLGGALVIAEDLLNAVVALSRTAVP